MLASTTRLACAQCGADAPSDPQELRTWVYGPLALSGEYDDIIDRLLLCPSCIEEERLHEFDEGGRD